MTLGNIQVENTWKQMVNSVDHHHSWKNPWMLKYNIRMSGRWLLPPQMIPTHSQQDPVHQDPGKHTTLLKAV